MSNVFKYSHKSSSNLSTINFLNKIITYKTNNNKNITFINCSKKFSSNNNNLDGNNYFHSKKSFCTLERCQQINR